MHIASEARLHELGIELPEQSPAIGSYRLAKRHRDIVYIAGHVSLRLDHSDLIRGKVGADLTVEEAYEARGSARCTCSRRCGSKPDRWTRSHASSRSSAW
jgi:hypothetical protein